ncbi:MAG: sigma-70 family RNA polymerase sigma factor [Cryobacterium sp.]|nr:sigma-70 family RNA polymerase sigma factor [Cryobacterium sp.]
MRPFENVVAEHGRTVLRVCRAALDPSDADDAWSETFLAALQAYPALPADANVEAWLVTIARRKAIDVLRARARLPITVDELPERDAVAELSVAPLQAVEAADLWGAVAALPTKQRLCVSYHYWLGLPHPEVAELVGGTAAAARRATSDGLATLRTLFTTGGH